MSFILNALRKSEQERQALQSEAATDRILLAPPPQSPSKATKLLVFLLIANVLVIAVIVWLVRNNSTSKPTITEQTALSPLSAKEETKANAKSVQPKRPAQKAEFEEISIAELIEREKPASLPVKPVITRKTVADAIKQPDIAGNSKLPIQTAPETAPAAKVEPAAPELIPVRKDISFLRDLPIEFRQTVPKFTINVFVYSEDPEQRFVMIDMVKYKQGQQIKDEMLLKEILPDSFVVDYQNRIFKIERP